MSHADSHGEGSRREFLYVATGAAVIDGKTSFNMIALASDGGLQQAFSHGGEYWNYAKWFFVLLFISFAIKVPAVPFIASELPPLRWAPAAMRAKKRTSAGLASRTETVKV